MYFYNHRSCKELLVKLRIKPMLGIITWTGGERKRSFTPKCMHSHGPHTHHEQQLAIHLSLSPYVFNYTIYEVIIMNTLADDDFGVFCKYFL